MMLAQARVLSHGRLWPSLALEGAVADEREETILGGGKACKAWSANHHSNVFAHP